MDTKGLDFQSMMASFMQNAQKMQENMRQMYQEMTEKNKETTVTGKAGGDLVIAHVNLKMRLTNLELKPAIFAEKHEVIVELITAAVNQALHAAQHAVKEEMMEITKKMGVPSEFPLPFGERE